MKKDTLIKLIDEEFGDGHQFSWLLEVIVRSVQKNDSKCQATSDEYEEQFKLVFDTLSKLEKDIKELEKKESRSIPIKRERFKLNKRPENKS